MQFAYKYGAEGEFERGLCGEEPFYCMAMGREQARGECDAIGGDGVFIKKNSLARNHRS